MSEWKNYGETTFTDFGSVGETQPVDAFDGGSMGGLDRTMPDGGFDQGYDGGATEAIDHTDWTDESKTQPVIADFVDNRGMTIRPTTGWLVCIEGATKGQDYRLFNGYNYIGRSAELNQVVIPDRKVSSKPSARILYDNESRLFYINECDGATNPVYLNGKLFDHRVELQPYDVIKLGDTKLLFVPLCTAKFSWEE
ncbi:MAG: FHA domain-containing protein [Aristaeellaceae bacterium]